jgi:uncharacterized membrane protein
MEEVYILLWVLVLLVVIAVLFILPISAFVISLVTKRRLTQRLAKLESLTGLSTNQPDLLRELKELRLRVEQLELGLSSTTTKPGPTETVKEPEPIRERPAPPPIPVEPQPTGPTPAPVSFFTAADLESVIGRRWIGWVAVLLILFATGFFLKYAFENRWIGEVGRVAIGIFGGALMTTLGFRYFKRGWKIFSQILTSGGVVLLYLSTYAAFGYYHLVPQKAAFAFLAILIAEAAALALIYEAPAIAIMALIGGFITPVLLHSNQDQHLSLFGYIIAIDLGSLVLL